MPENLVSNLLQTLTLSSGLRLSHHVVINIIESLPKEKKLTSAEFQHFLEVSFPSMPKISNEHWSLAEKMIQIHEKNSVECITFWDTRYPLSLKLIKNPPSILYFKGNLKLLQNLPGVAVVGTRKVTSNGAIIAQRLSAFLASEEFIIVSGLAIGVDFYAHQGALSVNGKTIAVLASGLHKASPKQNAILADEILLKGGAWVSEHPWGVEPLREYFVPRNRIQIGLSAGSIIVESEIKSGTSTQAEFCLESGRPLFAVIPRYPHNPLGLLSNGPLHLVENKEAIPIMSKDDYQYVITRLNDSKNKIINSI